VIRFRFKELVAEREFREGRRITAEDISRQTKIHRTTLSKLANQKGYNTTTDVLDKLCAYFEVEIGALAQFIPEPKADKAGEEQE
jgi:putative transcriptional regulator